MQVRENGPIHEDGVTVGSARSYTGTVVLKGRLGPVSVPWEAVLDISVVAGNAVILYKDGDGRRQTTRLGRVDRSALEAATAHWYAALCSAIRRDGHLAGIALLGPGYYTALIILGVIGVILTSCFIWSFRPVDGDVMRRTGVFVVFVLPMCTAFACSSIGLFVRGVRAFRTSTRFGSWVMSLERIETGNAGLRQILRLPADSLLQYPTCKINGVLPSPLSGGLVTWSLLAHLLARSGSRLVCTRYRWRILLGPAVVAAALIVWFTSAYFFGFTSPQVVLYGSFVAIVIGLLLVLRRLLEQRSFQREHSSIVTMQQLWVNKNGSPATEVGPS